jgi:hypothetical protein
MKLFREKMQKADEEVVYHLCPTFICHLISSESFFMRFKEIRFASA